MNKLEVAELFREIKLHYPHFDTGPEKRDSWHRNLQHVLFQDALTNLDQHILNEKFPPTVSEICRISENHGAFYHQTMKESAKEFLTDQDELSKKAVGPTLEQQERVREIFAKRNN